MWLRRSLRGFALVDTAAYSRPIISNEQPEWLSFNLNTAFEATASNRKTIKLYHRS